MSLASHEENLKYYGNFSTDELKHFLPQARLDVRETTARLAAVEEVLAQREDS